MAADMAGNCAGRAGQKPKEAGIQAKTGTGNGVMRVFCGQIFTNLSNCSLNMRMKKNIIASQQNAIQSAGCVLGNCSFGFLLF